jgi:hypothetical protein
MDTRKLIADLIASAPPVPPRAEVIGLRQHSLEDMQPRAKYFLGAVSDAFNIPVSPTDQIEQPGRTLIRLPLKSRLTLYHTSGAMRFVTGLEPMESLFTNGGTREALTKLVEEKAARMNMRGFIGRNESVQFERLWSIKASAASREGQRVEPALCRVVGAYRHFVGGLPVWGAASVSMRLAGNGRLDSVDWHVRETADEVIDRPEILHPEQAAKQIATQLLTLMGQSNLDLNEAAKPQELRFGYLSLPKRKDQRLLAPVYITAISVEDKQVKQGYIFAVPATEKVYLPLSLSGDAAPLVSRGAATTPVLNRGKLNMGTAFGLGPTER